MAAPTSLLGKLLFQIRRGFHEIPEVMSAGVVGTISTATLIWYVFIHQPEKFRSKRFKREYFVMRPDDPRLESVRRYTNSPPPTSY